MPLPPRTNVKILNPEIERLLFQVKVIVEEADGLFEGLSDAQFRWSPNPGAWSMGQCFDHLNTLARLYLVNVERAIAQGRAAGMLGEGPYVYGYLSRLFLRWTAPPVKRRFKAPAMFRPSPQQKSKETILAEWAQLHEKMKQLIEAANGIDLQRVKVQSPASKLFTVNLGMAFWILTAHEKRHMLQARQVRNSPGFPAA